MALAQHAGLRILLTVLLAGTMATSALAQVPSISSTFPQAVEPGKATDVKLRGGNLVGAADVWTSFPSEGTLTPDIDKNGENAAEVSWRLNVPADAAVGVHGIRVATPGGVSGLKLILVDDLPSVAQAAGNTTAEKAQELTLPVAVDGAVPSLGFNYYRFKAAAGQRIAIEAVARRLGSPLDPIIRLLDVKGRELAWSDDEPALRGDARLQFTFKDAGEYLVEIRDIRYQGGGGHLYRLRIGDFPRLSTPYPMAVQRGVATKVAVAGTDAASVAPFDVNIPADHPLNWVNVGARSANGNSSGFTVLHVSDSPVVVETEPNDEIKQATRIETGQTACGRIDKPGDSDHFVLTAKKCEKFTFRGVTRRQGSPTSVYLRLLKADGGALASKEDFGVGDPSFDYTFPADGDYVLVVEELHRRGGPEFAYRVEMLPIETGFTLSVAANTVNIGAGGTASIQVNVVRKGHNGPIQIAAVDLPDGVTSQPTVLGPAAKAVALTLTGTGDAPLNQVASVKIVGTAKIGDRDVQVVADTEVAMKAGFSAIPWAPENLNAQVALGVGAKPQIRLRTEVQEVVFGKQLTGSLKVIVDRDEGFNEAVTLAVTPDPKQGGLPANVTAGLKPIPKDKNEIVITFAGTDKAALGEFTAALTGTIKQGKTTVVQTVPGFTLKLQAPMTLALTPEAEQVEVGKELKAKVKVERNPALKGEITLAFQNLPKGVTVDAVKIPADQSEVEVVLKVAADAALGAISNLSVKGEATVGKAKLAATSPNVKLTVAAAAAAP